MKLNPFRMRYWVGLSCGNQLTIERSRCNPAATLVCKMYQLIDGPFDSQEDAVHSLNFWRLQLYAEANAP